MPTLRTTFDQDRFADSPDHAKVMSVSDDRDDPRVAMSLTLFWSSAYTGDGARSTAIASSNSPHAP